MKTYDKDCLEGKKLLKRQRAQRKYYAQRYRYKQRQNRRAMYNRRRGVFLSNTGNLPVAKPTMAQPPPLPPPSVASRWGTYLKYAGTAGAILAPIAYPFARRWLNRRRKGPTLPVVAPVAPPPSPRRTGYGAWIRYFPSPIKDVGSGKQEIPDEIFYRDEL